MSSIMKGIQGEQALDKTQPEIQVPGYGTMPLDMLQRHVQTLSKEFNDSIQQGEFLKAAYRTEQFYNALMALAKALKQQGVTETSSTGMGGGSAGIGGGAGLGIEKSPIEKVLEKPLGEGNLPPKAGFNKNPHKVGPGTSKDDYEYKKFIPRDAKEKGEEWAIARDVRNVNSRLGTKKPKELDTGFYKNYLGNRPVREEEVDEGQLYSTGGGAGQSYRKYKSKPAGLDEEHLNELSPETLASYKKKAGADASKADKEGDFERGNKRFSGIVRATKKEFDQDAKKVKEEQAPMFTPEEKMVNANDPRSDGWRVYKVNPAGARESAIMKGLQSEGDTGVTRWSKENPPPPELLLNTLIQILMKPGNRNSPQDLISLWNEMYGLKHTLGSLKQYAQNDYKKAELSKALTKAALAYESSEGK